LSIPGYDDLPALHSKANSKLMALPPFQMITQPTAAPGDTPSFIQLHQPASDLWQRLPELRAFPHDRNAIFDTGTSSNFIEQNKRGSEGGTHITHIIQSGTLVLDSAHRLGRLPARYDPTSFEKRGGMASSVSALATHFSDKHERTEFILRDILTTQTLLRSLYERLDAATTGEGLVSLLHQSSLMGHTVDETLAERISGSIGDSGGASAVERALAESLGNPSSVLGSAILQAMKKSISEGAFPEFQKSHKRKAGIPDSIQANQAVIKERHMSVRAESVSRDQG
jgi:hypothetical protein